MKFITKKKTVDPANQLYRIGVPFLSHQKPHMVIAISVEDRIVNYYALIDLETGISHGLYHTIEDLIQSRRLCSDQPMPNAVLVEEMPE